MNDLAWIFGIGIALVAIVFLFFSASLGGKKKLASVWESIRKILPDAAMTHRHIGEAMFETERTVYLIKAIPFHPDHELIVTNKTYWCVNDKPSQWKRSVKPDLISGVEDFLSWRPQTTKKVIRIGVVAPDCRNITFHVNECDVVVVDPTTDVHGYFLMRLSDVPGFLRKAERK